MGEWLERFFSSSNSTLPAVPDWQVPDWFQKFLFWGIVLGLILWASCQLYGLLQPYFSRYWHLNALSPTRPADRATELTISHWLERSRHAQQQGNYREACRALYMAALQHLNDQALIYQEPSRTDGEYLSLVQTLAASHPYQTLIHIHEQLCFSQVEISVEVFDRCWQAYREIEGQKRERKEEKGEGR